MAAGQAKAEDVERCGADVGDGHCLGGTGLLYELGAERQAVGADADIGCEKRLLPLNDVAL
jgi:hypothetical protein